MNSSIAVTQRRKGAKTSTLLLLSCLLFHCSGGARQAEGVEVDRVLAAVNGKVITESDIRMARSLNALLVFGQTGSQGEPSREEQLSRLIDLDLIRQELETLPPEPAEQKMIEARVEELKAGYAEIGGIEPIMRELGLRPAELQSYLSLQASIMRFVNLRFRPFVDVAPEEVRTYYNGKLVPKLTQAKADVPPFERVSTDIENILKEEKVNAALDAWIKEIRSHSRIEYFMQAQSPAAPDAAGEGKSH